MKNTILFYLILITLLSCGCSTKSVETPKHNYFSGEYTIKPESASFRDCATGKSYEVSKTKFSKIIKRSYLMLTPTPTEPLFVEFRGNITKDSMGEYSVILIDSLIGFKVGRSCTADELVVGVYESTSEGNVKSVLRLKSDNTYTQDIFITNDREVNSRGKWFRDAELELILQQEYPNADILSFEIIPSQESITENEGDKPLVYKKIYI